MLMELTNTYLRLMAEAFPSRRDIAIELSAWAYYRLAGAL